MSTKMTKSEYKELHKQVVETCRKNSAAFTQYVFGYKNASFHNDWHDFIDTHDIGVILAARGLGKCLMADSFVQIFRDNKTLSIMAKDVQIGDEIWSLDEQSYSIVKTKVKDVFDNGIKPIIKITTKSGRELFLTEEHPLYIEGNWIPVSIAKIGNFIGLSNKYNSGDFSLSRNECRLMGYLIGDGGTTTHTTKFTNIDKNILKDFENICKDYGWNISHDGIYTKLIVKNGSQYHPLDFTKKWKIQGCKSIDKKFPDFVFDLDEKSIGHLLGSYFDCDGYVSQIHMSNKSIEFYSGSKILLEQTQKLLVYLGIYSVLRYKKSSFEGKYFDSWRLSISCNKNLELFYKKVFLVGKKKNLLKQLIDTISQNHFPLIPSSMTNISQWRKNTYKLTTMEKASQNISEQNKKFITDDILWDEIVEIENKLLYPSIGIETENHTLCINDLITHNSEQVSVARVCWEIGHNPNIRVKMVTESDDLAKKILSAISNTLLYNDKYKEVFPHIKKSKSRGWNTKNITVERTIDHRDATVEAAGVMSGKTGGRSDLEIFDDIAGMRNTLIYPKNREMVKEAVFSNWMPMLVPESHRWYLIGTPWHIKDIVSDMRLNKSIPRPKEVVVGPNFESPWEERFSSDYYKKQLEQLGRRHYNRAYRLVPMSDDEAWINKGALEAAKRFDLDMNEIARNKNIVKFTGVDIGHRSGPDQCPTVVFTVALLENGTRVPCDIRVSHEANPLDIARLVINVAHEMKSCLVMVENNGVQQWLIDMIKEIGPGDIKIDGFYTSNKKADPNEGVPSLLAEIESGKWLIPLSGQEHGPACLCNLCLWVNETMDFPNFTTDTTMASFMALQALKKVKERANSGGGFSLWNWETGGVSR